MEVLPPVNFETLTVVRVSSYYYVFVKSCSFPRFTLKSAYE